MGKNKIHIARFLHKNGQKCNKRYHQKDSCITIQFCCSKLKVFIGLAIFWFVFPVTSKAQETNTQLEVVITQKTIDTAVATKQDGFHKIDGYIYEYRTGEPMTIVDIAVEGTYLKTTSNLDGYFSLSLPEAFYNQKNYITISLVGYDTQRFPLTKELQKMKIRLKTTNMNSDMNMKKPKLWKRIKYEIRSWFH